MLVGQTIGTGPFRFEIEEEIGCGAMGTVYRARFHRDGKVGPVALKMVALGLLGNEGAMARFDREANILKQLRHPNIVRLYATGHYRKTPFIAMEFITGEPLDRLLARRGKLAWEEVVGYGKDLCQALQYAHEKGIIHRDLKPSNLMLTADGVLKLTDFGIAKDQDVTALTGANSTIGTAAYMSPEQCKGDRNLTPRSDLYSLGVVFFELLSGRKPFAAESTVEMFQKHVYEAPPRVGKIVHDLPPKFETLILQLLEKDKEQRPTDAAWVGRMLAEVEDDMFARKSAGLAAATARRGDRRPRDDDPTLSEADRDAARALRGKKKRKKAAVPWYARPAVKGAGIVAVLVAMAVGVYLGTRPPSADRLAAAVDAAPSPADKAVAAEAYLKAYGTTLGPLTDRMVEAFREAKGREREASLARRYGKVNMRSDPQKDDREAYEAAMLAIGAERSGRLGDAVALWNKVLGKFKEQVKPGYYTLDEGELVNASMAWAAERRVAAIGGVRARTMTLTADIDDRRRFGTATKYDPASPESLATRALRLERFGDAQKAGRVWDGLAGLAEKEPELEVWVLMAAEHKAGLPKEIEGGAGRRLELVRKRVEAAEAKVRELRAANATEAGPWVVARTELREVAELYEDETDPAVAALAGRARTLLDAVKDEGK